MKTRADGSLAIDDKKVEAAQRRDGQFLVNGNDDTLGGEDLALGYKQLQRVEQAWRSLNGGLRLRLVYHRAPQRIRAHVTITVLALLLERMAEQACGDIQGNDRELCGPGPPALRAWLRQCEPGRVGVGGRSLSRERL